jgi:septum formation protein
MTRFADKKVKRLILASASPRRLAICRLLGLDPVVWQAFCRELKTGDSAAVVRHNARLKALSLKDKLIAGDLLIAADTIVYCKGKILGKPANEKEAKEMLRLLSASWHEVYTAQTVLSAEGALACGLRVTRVKFAPVSRREIAEYIKSGESADKAGAYAIQGIGGRFIERVEGDYLAVAGLSPNLLFKLAAAAGKRL